MVIGLAHKTFKWKKNTIFTICNRNISPSHSNFYKLFQSTKLEINRNEEKKKKSSRELVLPTSFSLCIYLKCNFVFVYFMMCFFFISHTVIAITNCPINVIPFILLYFDNIFFFFIFSIFNQRANWKGTSKRLMCFNLFLLEFNLIEISRIKSII